LVRLFSYGTLQQPEVQIGTFGRLLTGEPDTLRGYVLRPLRITVDRVVALSGAEVHSIACRSGDPADLVQGMAFESARPSCWRRTATKSTYMPAPR
jgi:hypothetical protein